MDRADLGDFGRGDQGVYGKLRLSLSAGTGLPLFAAQAAPPTDRLTS